MVECPQPPFPDSIRAGGERRRRWMMHWWRRAVASTGHAFHMKALANSIPAALSRVKTRGCEQRHAPFFLCRLTWASQPAILCLFAAQMCAARCVLRHDAAAPNALPRHSPQTWGTRNGAGAFYHWKICLVGRSLHSPFLKQTGMPPVGSGSANRSCCCCGRMYLSRHLGRGYCLG